jgi:hypothetical protein
MGTSGLTSASTSVSVSDFLDFLDDDFFLSADDDLTASLRFGVLFFD